MSVLKIDRFGGMLPAWDDTLLPPSQSANSRDAYLYSGALTGWRAPKFLRTLTNPAAQMAFRVPTISEATAGANLIFLTNANEGDTFKIGEEVYTITATIVPGYTVKLGGTATATATNIFKALTLTGVAGTDYGLGVCLNPAIAAPVQSTHDFGSGAIPTIAVLAPDTGAAFNATPVIESTAGARLRWLYGPLGGAPTLTQTTLTLVGGTNKTSDTSITGAATWLEFVDKETDVMRSPVLEEQFGRYYFASPSQPPQYNTYDRIVAAQPPWLLGVPAPGCAPSIAVSEGGNSQLLGFSDTSAPAGTRLLNANDMLLVKVTPGGAMVLNDVAFFGVATGGTANFKALLYSDIGGQPNGLINVGVPAPVAGFANYASGFTVPTPLLIDVPYWIGIIVDAGVQVALPTGGGTLGAAAGSSYAIPPAGPGIVTATGQATPNIWGDVTTAAVLEARAYVYTWVTAYDEEGPPSPPTIDTAWDNSKWTISMFTPPPDDMGVKRNITKTRIYRAITGSGGDTTYFFVAEIPVATATYVDTIDDSIVVANTQIPSTNWFGPPVNLQSIKAMPNGMSVGFKGNEIWFSEPYRPHAWPVAYMVTTEFPIVGIGVTGQCVVACTASAPAVVSGINPASMSTTKTHTPEPCLSRGSIVSTDEGIYYQSQNGLILVTPYGKVTNTTEKWITRERWRSLVPQKFVRAVRHLSAYFAFGSVTGVDVSVARQGFSVEMGSDANSFGLYPQVGGHRLGFNELSATADIQNMILDPWTAIVLLIQNGQVLYYDFADLAPAVTPFLWRSKKFQHPSKRNYSAFRVWFDTPAGSPVPGARNTAVSFPLGANMLAIVRTYANDVLVCTREVQSSGELLRIVSGFKAEFWQWEIEGRVVVSNLQVATSVLELGSI